ncbi:MAG: hypothetical protein GY869_05965, partial [Planctomycetes bacterium]|nr:hypothetical protein [Planctomycetota bacterium]
MNFYEIVVPEETTTHVLNPSAEATGNYFAIGATVTREPGEGWTGLNSYNLVTTANGDRIRLTLDTLANAIHYVTFRVKGTLPAGGIMINLTTNWFTPVEILSYDDEWSLYGVQMSAAESNGSVRLDIAQDGAGAGDFYIDGVNVTPSEYWTTHVDGDQPGCEWNAAANASTSTRSALSRAGGRVYDLADDFGFQITETQDTGAPSITNYVDTYALRPGGTVQGNKIHERTLTLMGKFFGTSAANLN